MDPYKVLIKPKISEQTMDFIDNNVLTFVVDRNSNKTSIKQAFEHLYDVKVVNVNTHINPKGVKVAFITLSIDDDAEDLAVKLGVF